jgi:hypothetical protein
VWRRTVNAVSHIGASCCPLHAILHLLPGERTPKVITIVQGGGAAQMNAAS